MACANTWGDVDPPSVPPPEEGPPELCAVRLILWDEYLGYVVIGEHPAADLRQPINLILDDPLIGPAMVIGQIAPVGTRTAHPDDIIHVELHPGPLPGEEQYPVVLKPAYNAPAHEPPAYRPWAYQRSEYQRPAGAGASDRAPTGFAASGATPMLASYESRFYDPTLPEVGAIVEAGPDIAGFGKGVAEGVADGVREMAAGVTDGVREMAEGLVAAGAAVGRGAADVAGTAYDLATDAEARRRMGQAIAHAARDMGDLADALWHHPGATARQALEAAGAKLGAAKAVLEQVAARIVADYARAADEGRGPEFIGHAAGEGLVAVGSLAVGGEVAAGLKAAAAATTLAAAKSTAKLAQALKALDAARAATTAVDAARTSEKLLVLEQRLQELAAAGQELDRAEQELAQLQAKVARMAQEAKAGDVAGNEPAGPITGGPDASPPAPAAPSPSAQPATPPSGPEPPSPSGAFDPVQPLIGRAKALPRTKGRTSLWELDGGTRQMEQDFDALKPQNVREISTSYGPGRSGKLPDGRSVVERPGSTDGRPTLEIRQPNGRGLEFRYNR